MKTTNRAASIAVSGVGLALLMGSTAYAFWSADGAGSAQAAAGTAKPVEAVASPSLSTGTLFPNGSVTAKVSVHNPNSFPVKVTRVVLGAAKPSSVSGGNGCTVDNAAVSMPAYDSGMIAAASQVIVNPGATATIDGGSIAMGLASANGCQGASFTFTGTGATSGPVQITAQAG